MDSALISFFIFSIIVCLSPGPSMFFVLSQGLSGNKWSGFAAVLGLTIANMIWIILSATGITALIHSSFIAFKIIKILGAAYLVIVFIIMSFYAFLGNYSVSILKREKIKRIFRKIIGSVFIITGLSLLKIKRA